MIGEAFKFVDRLTTLNLTSSFYHSFTFFFTAKNTLTLFATVNEIGRHESRIIEDTLRDNVTLTELNLS